MHLSNLSVLFLNDNEIDDEGAYKSLGEGLSQCSNLTQLFMHRNLIHDEGAKCLVDGLS